VGGKAIRAGPSGGGPIKGPCSGRPDRVGRAGEIGPSAGGRRYGGGRLDRRGAERRGGLVRPRGRGGKGETGAAKTALKQDGQAPLGPEHAGPRPDRMAGPARMAVVRDEPPKPLRHDRSAIALRVPPRARRPLPDGHQDFSGCQPKTALTCPRPNTPKPTVMKSFL
jgi:hypothetical protein